MDEGILQSEGLVSAICYLGLLFKSIPAGVVVEPQQIAMDVGHLARDDDLVAVEVVGLLAAFSVFVVRYCGSGSWYGCSCSRSCV